MTTDTNDFINNILRFQYNPAAIQQTALGFLSDLTNGARNIVDPTNPFVFLMETSACCTAASMIKNEVNNRKQNAIAAQTVEDLYLHMSDKDYIDRFATPATAYFTILIPKDELINKLVREPSTGYMKLTIPRNTYFTVGDVSFSLQYPIDIRQLAHGGIQIVYNNDINSPLQELTTNIIDYEYRTEGSTGIEYIWFQLETRQFTINSQTGSLTTAKDFQQTIGLTDQFYFARVYVQSNNGVWNEIATTHTEQIYDIKTPTAVLKVLDKSVSVTIPQVYTNTILQTGKVRIDIYETKGALKMALSAFPFSAFTATWSSIDKNDATIFTAPLKNFQTIRVASEKDVDGGNAALDFETLRTRVIQNTIGPQRTPITNVQIETSLAKKGYGIFKVIDNITDRTFQATRAMPAPTDERLITAAAASIETITLSVKNLIKTNNVIDNGTSITITPDTIYQNIAGVTSPVPAAQLEQLLSLSVDKQALAVTNGSYLYTPFHYVLDMTNNEFNVRPYYLDNPTAIAKSFVSENDTTLIQVGTDAYDILRTSTGYAIRIKTRSGEQFKALRDDEVFVQLAFIPAGERDYAYLNGIQTNVMEDGERVFLFDLSSTFNVNRDGNLELTKFKLYTNEDRKLSCPLLTKFEILFSTSAVLDSNIWIPEAIDRILGRILLPARIAGITHETLTVRFGHSLDMLWARARSLISSREYQVWDTDVPRLYTEDVYQKDEHGSVFQFDQQGNPITVILHHRGDPVLDGNNQPTYQYRKGDVKLDLAGKPLIASDRDMLRQVDLMLIEGSYRFATDIAATNYRSDLTKSIVTWLTDELTAFVPELLDKTKVFFYPKTTSGEIKVVVGDGVIKAIPAGQAFIVVLSVTDSVYRNIDLRNQLTKTTIRAIGDSLKERTISISAVTDVLRGQYGNDVIDVQLSGLGGSANYSLLTVVDETDRLSIRKRLVALPDDSLIVEEDISFSFIRHSIT